MLLLVGTHIALKGAVAKCISTCSCCLEMHRTWLLITLLVSRTNKTISSSPLINGIVLQLFRCLSAIYYSTSACLGFSYQGYCGTNWITKATSKEEDWNAKRKCSCNLNLKPLSSDKISWAG